jgi:creatinine amidohydrolase/Fe(II)-dependent formamide hydrolase-like protein
MVGKGFKKLMVINIHKGNDAAIKVTIERIFAEPGHPLFYINPYTFMKDELDPEIFNGKDNSYKEASLLYAALHVLCLDGSSSVLDRAFEDEMRDLPEELNLLRKYGTVGFAYFQEPQHVSGRKDVDMNLD